MTAPDRTERGHPEFPFAVWTSFDRYSRYGTIARTVRSCLGPGRHQVLDVGESSAYLALFDPDLPVISVDIKVSAAPLEGAVRVLGDGRSLPFPDGSLDAAVSSDTLEHIPGDDRTAFAPSDTPGVVGAEELVRRFALIATGAPQVQLEEHGPTCCPTSTRPKRCYATTGWKWGTRDNDNLHDWLLMMLVKYRLGHSRR